MMSAAADTISLMISIVFPPLLHIWLTTGLRRYTINTRGFRPCVLIAQMIDYREDYIDQLEDCGDFHDGFERVVAVAAFLMPFFPLAHCFCTSFRVIMWLID